MPSFLSRLFGAFATKREAPQRSRPEQLDDGSAGIVARLSPPTDRRSSAAWDDYWRWWVSSGFAFWVDMMLDDCELVTLMRQHRRRLVLVAGNGISIEPRALRLLDLTS